MEPIPFQPGFEFRVVIYLDWLPPKARELNLPRYLTHSSWKMDSYPFSSAVVLNEWNTLLEFELCMLIPHLALIIITLATHLTKLDFFFFFLIHMYPYHILLNLYIRILVNMLILPCWKKVFIKNIFKCSSEIFKYWKYKRNKNLFQYKHHILLFCLSIYFNGYICLIFNKNFFKFS